jgi:hypothetical protein
MFHGNVQLSSPPDDKEIMPMSDISKAKEQSRKLAELFQRRAKLFEELKELDDQIEEISRPVTLPTPPPPPKKRTKK